MVTLAVSGQRLNDPVQASEFVLHWVITELQSLQLKNFSAQHALNQNLNDFQKLPQ